MEVSIFYWGLAEITFFCVWPTKTSVQHTLQAKEREQKQPIDVTGARNSTCNNYCSNTK